MELTWLDCSVLVAYLVGLFLLGVFTSRQQTSADVYFLAGRRTPWLLAGVSVLATLLSTLTYLSLPGEMIAHGTGYFYSLFAFVLIIPLVNRGIIPSLMRLRVASVYDFLEQRYGLEARVLGAAVFVLTRITWIGLIMYTAARAVDSMTEWGIVRIVLVLGVVTTFYTTSGGFKAVVWSDFAQFVLLAGAAVFVPVYIAVQTGAGPLAWWADFSTLGRTSAPLFSLDPAVRITIVGIIVDTLVWNLCTHGADQVAAQRYLSTPSAAAARRSVWVFSVCNIVLALLLMTCGLALFYYKFHDSALRGAALESRLLEESDSLLPTFIAQELPQGVTGLVLAALLAAAMSSISSGVNSISTVIFSDFVERFGRAGKTRSVSLAMVLAALAGLAGIGVALGVDYVMRRSPWNLIEMIGRINHLFVAPLGALFISGLIFRRVGSAAALAGFALGVATSMLVSFGREFFDLDYDISFTWIMPASFAVSLAGTYLLSWLLPRSSG